jgi:hypothetical protein
MKSTFAGRLCPLLSGYAIGAGSANISGGRCKSAKIAFAGGVVKDCATD